MDIKTAFILVTLLSVSCKKDVVISSHSQEFDTVYVETNNNVDTLLLNTEKPGKSIWFSKITYAKTDSEKYFILGNSLSHNKFIAINNIKGSSEIEILGDEPIVKTFQIKNNDFITVTDSSYNYGNLTKFYFSFLIAKNLATINEEKFELNSKNDGKTYNKNIDLLQTTDTVYLKEN